MKKRCVGDRFQIQCYKHNKKIHRAWDEAILLKETNEYMIFGNDRTIVTEADGNRWRTKEPAIMYYFKNEWFNIIAQLKNDGIFYYCNIATPFILEDNTIKYIDYDLDLRIFPDGRYKILDQMEYNYHKRVMSYSKELDIIINKSLEELIDKYNNNFFAFSKNQNQLYCMQYIKLKNIE